MAVSNSFKVSFRTIRTREKAGTIKGSLFYQIDNNKAPTVLIFDVFFLKPKFGSCELSDIYENAGFSYVSV